MPVDPRAASGFASAVDAYERGRPSYPPEAIAHVVAELGLGSASTVLDLAAGTGKLTRLLLPLVGRLVAVDASEPMLAKLRDQLPQVEAVAGTAEAIPLGGATVDAVFVAEAFHWFAAAPACAEIARVLRPHGGVALLWNSSKWTGDELSWIDDFNGLVQPYRDAAGSFPSGGDAWKDALSQSGWFEPLSHAEYEHVNELAPEDFVALVASWSWIANVAEPERSAVLARVRELASSDSRIELRYTTALYWTRLLGTTRSRQRTSRS